jgi:hypothetical protein
VAFHIIESQPPTHRAKSDRIQDSAGSGSEWISPRKAGSDYLVRITGKREGEKTRIGKRAQEKKG